jgi:hypothetical protein
MVILAKGSPGRRSTPPLQSKKATVMLVVVVDEALKQHHLPQ